MAGSKKGSNFYSFGQQSILLWDPARKNSKFNLFSCCPNIWILLPISQTAIKKILKRPFISAFYLFNLKFSWLFKIDFNIGFLNLEQGPKFYLGSLKLPAPPTLSIVNVDSAFVYEDNWARSAFLTCSNFLIPKKLSIRLMKSHPTFQLIPNIRTFKDSSNLITGYTVEKHSLLDLVYSPSLKSLIIYNLKVHRAISTSHNHNQTTWVGISENQRKKEKLINKIKLFGKFSWNFQWIFTSTSGKINVKFIPLAFSIPVVVGMWDGLKIWRNLWKYLHDQASGRCGNIRNFKNIQKILVKFIETTPNWRNLTENQ